MNKKLLFIAGIALLIVFGSILVNVEKETSQIAASVTTVLNEPSGLKKLLDGNERYVNNRPNPRKNGEGFRKELSKSQAPFAVVVACSDSRVDPGIIFDANLGDIFVIRTAGNVVDPVALGSVEYALEHLKTPLIVVLGHENCGAVKASIESETVPEGNIGEIIKEIMPAVEKARSSSSDPGLVVLNATVENIKNVISKLMHNSTVIEELEKEGKITIVGAYYSISTGKVTIVKE